MASSSHRASSNELRVSNYANTDYDLDVPDEAPPSYEEVMASSDTNHSDSQNRIQQTTRNKKRRAKSAGRAEQLDPISLSPSSARPHRISQSQSLGPQSPVNSPTISQSGSLPAPISWPVNPNTPWRYPSNYYCYKCQNTGIKLKNGLSCKDCWQLLGPQSSHIQQLRYIPDGVVYSPSLAAGDPALGGVLCGGCRGTGYIDFLFFNASCPVCHGIGRVLIV